LQQNFLKTNLRVCREPCLTKMRCALCGSCTTRANPGFWCNLSSRTADVYFHLLSSVNFTLLLEMLVAI
jgi:hypothetical protein